jgi:hypothetical protein
LTLAALSIVPEFVVQVSFPRNRTWLLALLASMLPSSAIAQLRPLDPVDWRVVSAAPGVSAALGAGAFAGQYATRAGTRGHLYEFGNFVLAWTTGRVTVEGSGTIVRRFREEERLSAPAEGVVEASSAGTRQDAGDFRVATIVRLSPARWSSSILLRFGTRLPTTDDRIGLDRDQTDFFALLGGRRPIGRAALFGEAGVSINGTRLPEYEQADVLVYSGGVDFRFRAVDLHVMVVGRDDLHDWSVRGSEDLSELRAGVRFGGARWLQLSYVRGIAEHSPRSGMLVMAGVRGIGTRKGAGQP